MMRRMLGKLVYNRKMEKSGGILTPFTSEILAKIIIIKNNDIISTTILSTSI